MKVLIACEESQTVCMAFRVEPLGLWVGSSSSRRDAKKKHKYQLSSIRDSKRRAKTFPGIAAAMAEQWGCLEV